MRHIQVQNEIYYKVCWIIDCNVWCIWDMNLALSIALDFNHAFQWPLIWWYSTFVILFYMWNKDDAMMGILGCGVGGMCIFICFLLLVEYLLVS